MESRLQKEWAEFHAANPGVCAELVQLARETKSAGAVRCGIGMLWEVMRWRVLVRVARKGSKDFKLNNNYRSRYARHIMATYPDLRGFFETRALRSL